MPYGERREVAVTMQLIPGLLYAFRTDVDNTSSTALGHIDASSGSGYKPGVVFGINSPKPPRARKFFGAGGKRNEESFIAHGSIAAARADGWEIKPGKIASLRNTPFSKVVSVDYKLIDAVAASEGVEASSARTMKYAWKMPEYQYNKLLSSDKAALGIEDFDQTKRGEYIMGASKDSARPNRASKIITVGDRQIKLSTFVAHNKEDNLTNGWSLAN